MDSVRFFLKRNPLVTAAMFLFLVMYSNSLTNPFLRDDIPQIAANQKVQDGSVLASLFSKEYFSAAGSVAYRPAVEALRAAEYRVFGADQRLWRALSLLLHAANAVMLLSILVSAGCAVPAALAAFTLFLLHPVHTEVLNYISNGQCDIICLFFLETAALAYLRRLDTLFIFAFCLAALSKEMALVFPGLVALYGISRGEFMGRWKPIAISAVLACAFLLWRLFYFKAGPGFIDKVSAGGAFGISWAGLPGAVLRAPALVIYYLKLLVWPYALSVEADRLLPEAGLFSGTAIALSWAAVVAMVVALYNAPRFRAYATLFVSFILALLPVLGLVPLTSVLQEHFIYIPSVFFCIVAGLVFADLLHWKPYPALASALFILCIFSGRIWVRNLDWRSPLALAESDIRNFPGSPYAMTALARQKDLYGDSPGALRLCSEAISAGPADGEPYFIAAGIYMRGGDREKAIGMAREGVSRFKGPDALVSAARIFAAAGNQQEALSTATEAVVLYPYFAPAVRLMAGMHAKDPPAVGAATDRVDSHASRNAPAQ